MHWIPFRADAPALSVRWLHDQHDVAKNASRHCGGMRSTASPRKSTRLDCVSMQAGVADSPGQGLSDLCMLR